MLRLFMKTYSAIDLIFNGPQINKMKDQDYDYKTLSYYSWGIKNIIPDSRYHMNNAGSFDDLMASRPVLLLLPKHIQDKVKIGLEKNKHGGIAYEEEKQPPIDFDQPP